MVLAVITGCAFGRPQFNHNHSHRPHRPGNFGVPGRPVGGAPGFGGVAGQNCKKISS